MSDGRLRPRRRWIGLLIAATAALLVFAVAWVLVRGIGAADHLKGIASTAEEIKTKIADDELRRIPALANRIDEHAQAARDLTSDPVWRAFEFIPGLGPNFTAVRETAEIANEVAGDAVQPIAQIVDRIDLTDLGFSGGRIDLTPFAEIEEPLRGAAAALASAADRAERIDADATLPPLGDAVRDLRETMTEGAGLVGALHGASALLPSMLGQDGPRTYVVAMMNNAELRSEGGIVGAMAVVRATDGQIELIGQASSWDMPALSSALPLSDEVVALWGDRPGRFIQNTTSIPDFTEAGPVIAEMWKQRWGYPVDGVLAVDATVAASLIGATGPLTIGPLALEEDTAVDLLLSEIYALIPDPPQQDAVFAQVAAALLNRALASDPKPVLAALAASADEQRIRIWSAHEDEQRILAASTLGGSIPQDVDGRPAVGVLINDQTGAKMDYYARAGVVAEYGACRGEKTTRLTVTWTNDAPADAGETLPPYVTADGAYGVPAGETETQLALFGPQDGLASAYSQDGEKVGVQTAVIDGRPVLQFTVRLAPGESTEVSVEFTGEGAGERLTRVLHTPMASAADVEVRPIECDH